MKKDDTYSFDREGDLDILFGMEREELSFRDLGHSFTMLRELNFRYARGVR